MEERVSIVHIEKENQEFCVYWLRCDGDRCTEHRPSLLYLVLLGKKRKKEKPPRRLIQFLFILDPAIYIEISLCCVYIVVVYRMFSKRIYISSFVYVQHTPSTSYRYIDCWAGWPLVHVCAESKCSAVICLLLGPRKETSDAESKSVAHENSSSPVGDGMKWGWGWGVAARALYSQGNQG